MALSLKTAVSSGNPNLPLSLTSAGRRTIMAANPAMWLRADAAQMDQALDGTLAAIGDLTSKTWTPTQGQRPAVVDAGTTKALRFAVGTDGAQALTCVGDPDLLPASPSPLTLVALVKCASGMAVDRSVIVGSRDATPMALFVNNTGGNAFFMSKYNDGVSVMNGGADVTDSAWHTIMVAIAGTGAGGQVFLDGVSDSTNSGNTFTRNANRKLIIGTAGLTGAGRYFEGDLGALLILPTDIRASGNSELLLAVNAEFAAERAKRV